MLVYKSDDFAELKRARAEERASQLSHHLTAVAPHAPETPGDHPMADVTPDEHELPLIISVDDHVLEPKDLWQRELPASLRDRGPRCRPRK